MGPQLNARLPRTVRRAQSHMAAPTEPLKCGTGDRCWLMRYQTNRFRSLAGNGGELGVHYDHLAKASSINPPLAQSCSSHE
jgi:hypothetical protein